MALKIYFCDGCNESIPLKDINENRITIDAGKIFCARCAPKKPAKEKSGTSPAFAILIALVGIGFGLIAFLTSQQIRDVGVDVRDARKDVASLQAEVAANKREAMPRAEVEGIRSGVLGSLAQVQRDVAGQADRLKVHEGLVRTEVSAAEKRLEETLRGELTALAKQLDGLAGEWRVHAAGAGALKEGLAAVEASVAAIRTDLAALETRAAAGTNGTESAPSDELPDDASREFIAALKDPDPGRRFGAVIELGRFRTPAVVEALVGMLQDPESYVRDGSVRALRKINAPSSIPAVIKTLRDEDFFVRTSAKDALASMTHAGIAFDPGADQGAREARVREWEEWWSLNQDRLLRRR
jgi:hypothetical protein